MENENFPKKQELNWISSFSETHLGNCKNGETNERNWQWKWKFWPRRRWHLFAVLGGFGYTLHNFNHNFLLLRRHVKREEFHGRRRALRRRLRRRVRRWMWCLKNREPLFLIFFFSHLFIKMNFIGNKLCLGFLKPWEKEREPVGRYWHHFCNI